MKAKHFILILVISILFSFVACQSAAVPSQDTNAATSEQATQDIQEPATQPTDTTAPLLDGSFSTPGYEVSVIDGKCYLNFTAGNEAETDSGSSDNNNASMVDVNFIRFDSLAEMKQKLEGNGLTEEQKSIIKTKFTLSENGFDICNVQDLIQPSVPSELFVDSVYLYGTRYEFLLRDDPEAPQLSVGMCWGDAGKWERQYAFWMDVIDQNQLDNHENGDFDGSPCETYIFTTKSAQVKHIYLTFNDTESNTPTHVMLEYALQANSGTVTVSDTIPIAVYLFGEKDGIPFDYYLSGLTEAPTVEWLSSFSIAPYVDTGNHVAS